jgi:hypothetical protein
LDLEDRLLRAMGCGESEIYDPEYVETPVASP